jgi:hypothetical protein
MYTLMYPYFIVLVLYYILRIMQCYRIFEIVYRNMKTLFLSFLNFDIFVLLGFTSMTPCSLLSGCQCFCNA